MQQIPIYFKSDFKLFIQTEAGFAVPFKFEFYTNMPSRPYIVKYDGHKYNNCELLEDGRLCIAFDDHGFGLGKLMIRQSYYLNDADYASEICDRVIAPQPVVNIDDNLLRSEIVLALSGDDTIEFTSQLPPYYQAGLTPEEHQALIDATVHAEEAASSANEQAGIATEAAKAADDARQALTTAYNEKVAALDADYAQKKSALEADYSGVKDALSSDYASVKAQLDADYAATKEALTTDYATALAGLNDRMTAIESQFSVDREAWNKSVADFITASQATFDGKLTDWQSQVDAAIADITRLQEKDVEQDQKLSELDNESNEIDFRALTILGIKNPYVRKDFEAISEIDYRLIEQQGRIENGNVVLSENYYHTSPIALSKGDVLVVYCNSYSPFWETDESGSYYKDLGYSILKATYSQYFKHVATKDCYIALSYFRSTETIPEAGGAAIRIYKYISPSEAHIKSLIENNSDLIKENSGLIKATGAKKTVSQIVPNTKYAKIATESKKVSVKITSAPEGRLIISAINNGVLSVRLQDYAVVGKTYFFDISVDYNLIVVQNFTGVEGTIEFEIIDGYIQEIREEIHNVSEGLYNLSKDVDTTNTTLIKVVQSTNLFNPNDQDIILGKYINREGSIANNSSYNITGYIPVEGGKTYYFGKNGTASAYARTLEFYDSSRKVIAGSFINNVFYNVIASSGAAYMRCSVEVRLWDGFQVNANELLTYEEWFEPYKIVKIEDSSITMDMLSDSVKEAINVKSFNSFKAESELMQGEVLTLASVHIGKNSVETAHIEGVLSKISVGVGYIDNTQYLNRDYASCWVEIDQTSIRQYRSYNNTEEYTLIDERAHGLTLTNNTVIEINNQVNVAKLRVYNDIGDLYEQNIQVGVGKPFIINEGTNSITTKLSFMPQEINMSIWAFGDSYFNFTSDIRWPYYFEQNGYTNWLSDNQPGLSPTSALTDLENLLLLGARPKYVLWCLGMNGATTETIDSEGNYIINPAQKSVIDSVVNLCRSNNIELVLTTIPTVPTRQKTGFNNYVRSLGVKYIDFEKAVGTNSSGEWNAGLLSSDGIHPTAAGAKVLASRVLVDFPELTIV